MQCDLSAEFALQQYPRNSTRAVLYDPCMPSYDLTKELQARAGDLTDVNIRHSRFGPMVAFYRGKKEFAHIQRPGTIDIRLTKPLIRRLKPDYRLEINPDRDWLVAHFDEEADLNFILGLLERAWRVHKE